MASALTQATATYGIATGSCVDERDDWAAAIERARAEGWRWLELTALRGRLDSLLPFDVVLHPDVYGEEPACEELGRHALFENMDVTKRFGRSVADLDAVFAAWVEGTA